MRAPTLDTLRPTAGSVSFADRVVSGEDFDDATQAAVRALFETALQPREACSDVNEQRAFLLDRLKEVLDGRNRRTSFAAKPGLFERAFAHCPIRCELLQNYDATTPRSKEFFLFVANETVAAAAIVRVVGVKGALPKYHVHVFSLPIADFEGLVLEQKFCTLVGEFNRVKEHLSAMGVDNPRGQLGLIIAALEEDADLAGALRARQKAAASDALDAAIRTRI